MSTEAGSEKVSSQSIPQSAPQDTPQITIDDFKRVKLCTGIIQSAEVHPNADRLLVLQVDIGEEKPRQLVAGIKTAYEPAQLIGKQVVVVANLKPAILRGVESQGMVLAATDADGIVLLSPDRATAVGSSIR